MVYFWSTFVCLWVSFWFLDTNGDDLLDVAGVTAASASEVTCDVREAWDTSHDVFLTFDEFYASFEE